MIVKAYEKTEDEECELCHEMFQEGENIMIFKCNHYYHKECADAWLQYRKICPQCNESAT